MTYDSMRAQANHVKGINSLQSLYDILEAHNHLTALGFPPTLPTELPNS